VDEAWSNPATSSWDFFSGRGDGATRGDKWAVRQRRASLALGGALARDDDFWNYATAIAMGDDEFDRVAGLYVPRESPARDAIKRLLQLAGKHHAVRWDCTGERAGYGILMVTTAAGPITYSPDSRVNAGNAYSDAGMQALDDGARLITRRGAERCLECGERLPETRRQTQRAGRRGSERVNYCPDCLDGDVGKAIARQGPSTPRNVLGSHLEAMRMVLSEATPQILNAHPEWEELFQDWPAVQAARRH
jgi:hypothetical protein